MPVDIIAIGKVFPQHPEAEIIQEYLKRCRWKVNIKELPSSRHRDNELALAKQDETKRLLDASQRATQLLVCDEKGKQITSVEFAKLLASAATQTTAVIIGGAYGLDRDELSKVPHTPIAFGCMTLPHQLVRVILAEQIYRAYTICNNHPYHKA